MDARRSVGTGEGSALLFPEIGETLPVIEAIESMLVRELDLKFAISFAISIREFGRVLARDAARDIGWVDAREMDRDAGMELTREADCEASVLTVAREVVRLEVHREFISVIGN